MFDEVKYEDLLGKPFQLGGRGPRFYDCYGICLELATRVGLILPEVLTPETTEDQHDLIGATADKDFEEIPKPEAFCIATFSIRRPLVDHCGFVLGDCCRFVHILPQHSVVRARLDLYKPRVHAFYRLCS